MTQSHPALPLRISFTLPSPIRQEVPYKLMQQNPPALLTPKIVCPIQSAYVADAAASPFPASAGSKGIIHQTFLRKIVCQQGCFSPLL